MDGSLCEALEHVHLCQIYSVHDHEITVTAAIGLIFCRLGDHYNYYAVSLHRAIIAVTLCISALAPHSIPTVYEMNYDYSCYL